METNNNFFENNLPKEKTEEYPSIQEGNYLACLGKVHVESRRNGVQVVYIDHILIQRKDLESTPADKPYIYTDYDSEKKSLSLRRRLDGTPLIAGIMYNPSFPLTFDSMSNKFKGFQTYRKRSIAKNFGALNEESGIVDWNIVAKYAGQIVSFQIFKNTYQKDGQTKTNMDWSVESYSLIPGSKVPLEQVQLIYLTIDDAKDSPKSSEPTVPDKDLPF